MLPALTTVLTVLEVLAKLTPTIIQVGTDLKPFAIALYEKVNGHLITPEQSAELEAMTDALYARLQEPLPPAQPGDPDYEPVSDAPTS